MSFHPKTFPIAVAMTVSLLFCTSSFAQVRADLAAAAPSTSADSSASAAPSALPDDPGQAPQRSTAASTSDGWSGTVGIYGWFPGLHGTVGALGHDASVHSSFSDIFHVLKGIIPVYAEANKGRFVMPIDFLWMKLGINNTIPIEDITQTTLSTHLTESILTPKVGYRVINGEHLKVDALGGVRYWYLGLNNTLQPSGVSSVKSASWVDGLGGARIQLAMSPKASIQVSGDAGAGGANLDYQLFGMLNLKLTQKLGVGLGWRYLDVDYQPGNHQFVFDTITSGPLAGIYFDFGGKPPVPPTASCSASPTEVFPGDPVNATINTENFNPKHPITYKWSANGATVAGTSTSGTVDASALVPGSYTVMATATDAKEKKNNIASCTAAFSVKARPNFPPTANCSASPNAIAINQSATINITASSPENRPLTYAWTSTGGQLNGSGASASLTATNADAGNTITVTGTATDDHNLSTSCTAAVTVPAVQKVSQVEDWGECTFEKNPKKPWRVDNDCKDVLDKLALRVQQMPDGRVAIVGYTDQEEVVNAEQLGAQRAVNIKYYLTTDEIGPKLDPARLEPRKGGTKGKAAHFYFVPQGATFTQEESVTVDETVVQGQSRSAAAPVSKKKAKKTAAEPSGN